MGETMKTKELLEKLILVKTGIDNRGDETAKSFLFSEGKLYAYSERIFVSVPLKTDLDMQVPSKTLFEYIKKLKNEDVELINENGSLRVVSGRNKVLIPAEERVKIPTDLVEYGETHELPFNFGENIDLALFSIGNDPTRPYLSVVKINEDNVETTNNISITRVENDFEIKDTLYIPEYAAKNMSVINPHRYSISGNWLIFENEAYDLVFCCRMVDAEKFPNLDSIFDRTMDWKDIEFPSEMKESIEKAILFTKHANKNEQTVRVTSDGESLRVVASSKAGEYSDTMSYSGSSFKFTVNAKEMLSLLKRRPKIALCGNIMKLENGLEIHLVSLGV
jgi:DNA polymerase III sliding clamp (beta) subunit (PCNA family)